MSLLKCVCNFLNSICLLDAEPSTGVSEGVMDAARACNEVELGEWEGGEGGSGGSEGITALMCELFFANLMRFHR